MKNELEPVMLVLIAGAALFGIVFLLLMVVAAFIP